MTDRCPNCNALYSMVGRAHNCKQSLSGGGESRPARQATSPVGEARRRPLQNSLGEPTVGSECTGEASVAPSPLNLSSEEQKSLHEALRRSVTIVKRGRPRLEDAKNTLAATKPWIALSMSERTWYRRQKEKNGK